MHEKKGFPERSDTHSIDTRVGCSDLVFNDAENGARKSLTLGGVTLYEGDMISLNGATGEVISGAAEVAVPKLEGDVLRVLKWADEHRKMKVLANADTPEDAEMVRCNFQHAFASSELKAEIPLCFESEWDCC
jgi:hypothetical protein